MDYFTLAELTASKTASARGIDNTPEAYHLDNLKLLRSKVLNPVRAKYGSAICVNSGYRCPDLNRAVGGSATSDHMQGRAADLSVGSVDGNKALYKLIREMMLEGEIVVDQLIEYPSKGYTLVHVSYRAEGNRNMILKK
ncbi:MAG: D-Ala-D-Ala carboxypeptidase family metallohydrolase [Rikenellaceae bacterium]